MQNLSYLFMKASRQLKNKLDTVLAEYEITAAQFSVIKQIEMSDAPITAAEIAESLKSDRPTISGIIHRLEKKGIVVKVDHETDKRSSYLEISKGAGRLVEDVTKLSDNVTAELFSGLSEVETEQLIKIIHLVIERTEME